MNEAFAEQVRQHAYEMWMADGCVDGRAYDHWIAAERELLAEAAAQAKRTTAPKRAAAKPAAAKSATPRAKKAVAAKPAGGAVKTRATARISPDVGGASA